MICRKRVRSSSEKSSAVRATRARSSDEICRREESLPATLATMALRKKRTTCRAKCVGLWPSVTSLSTSRKTSWLEFAATACIIFFQHIAGNGAHQLLHHFSSQGIAAAGDGLVHDGERIAHGTVAGLGQQGDSIAVGLDLFLFGDGGELVH